jgi:hypothetical protein
MKLNPRTKLIGGVLAAIVLGAVGNGFWQYILEPLLTKSSRAMLDLATLGVESFKNDLYREIAKGFHEKASNALYVQFNLLFGYLLLVVLMFLPIMIRKLAQRKAAALMEELWSIEAQVEKKTPSVDELRETLRNIKPQRFLWFVYALFFVVIVAFSAQLVELERDKYVNSAVTHYFQLKRIVSPYIDQKELKVLDSRFAQVQSAKDYIAIISHMSTIAKHSDAMIPEFEVWE